MLDLGLGGAKNAKFITPLPGHHQFPSILTNLATSPLQLVVDMPDRHIINLALEAYRLGRFPSLNSAAKA